MARCGAWSPQSQGYDPLLWHGICEGHRRPWSGSWGAVSSSVTCVASASVLPSAEGHLHRVIGRNGENVYGKKKKVVSGSLPDAQKMRKWRPAPSSSSSFIIIVFFLIRNPTLTDITLYLYSTFFKNLGCFTDSISH